MVSLGKVISKVTGITAPWLQAVNDFIFYSFGLNNFNDRGDFASGSNYAVNDYVIYPGYSTADSALYVCISPIANATTAPPSDTAHWGVFGGGQATWYAYSCWGDSLTFGMQQTASTVSYPGVLSTGLQAQVFNGGISGQTSTQIMARMLAAPLQFDNFCIFWEGRNNYNFSATVQSDIAAQVAALYAPQRYLVLSIPNQDTPNEYTGQTDYNTIIALNNALAATYGSRYLDVRAYLISQYNPADAQDVIDHGNDVWPSSLRAVDASGFLPTISPTDTTFTPTFTKNALLIGQTIKVGTERIYVTGVSGTTVTTCVRGYAGTTAAGYTSGQLFVCIDPLHLGPSGYTMVAQYIESYLASNPQPYTSNFPVNNLSIPAIFAQPPYMGPVFATTLKLTTGFGFGPAGNGQVQINSNLYSGGNTLGDSGQLWPAVYTSKIQFATGVNGPSFGPSGNGNIQTSFIIYGATGAALGDSTTPWPSIFGTIVTAPGRLSIGGLVVDTNFDVQTITTGGSYTIPNTDHCVNLHATGTIAAFTVITPAAPTPGQVIGIATDQIITALTVQANSGQTIQGSVTTLALGGIARYRYNPTGTVWQPYAG